MIESTITGLKELDDRLKQIEPKLAARELGNALRAGASVIQKRAIERAPDNTYVEHKKGDLKANIRVQRIRATEREAMAYGITTGPAFWAKFVEFGRGIVRVAKKKVLTDGLYFFGKEVRAMPARPFMRPALDEGSARALTIMRDRLKRGLDRIARKG